MLLTLFKNALFKGVDMRECNMRLSWSYYYYYVRFLLNLPIFPQFLQVRPGSLEVNFGSVGAGCPSCCQ